jgi:acyl-coenzyme A thioesterase PaaI-like protein
MRHLQRATIMFAGLLVTLLLTAGSMAGVAHAGKTPSALAADHVVACIRTAVAAQAGLVKEAEVKYKRGQWLCEVEIVDDTGQTYELQVDVATNAVVKAERD